MPVFYETLARRTGTPTPELRQGDRVDVAHASVQRRQTQPPRFLQEHELIERMDAHRIGTDASMAVHVSNIVDRGFVVVCDETGGRYGRRGRRAPAPSRAHVRWAVTRCRRRSESN